MDPLWTPYGPPPDEHYGDGAITTITVMGQTSIRGDYRDGHATTHHHRHLPSWDRHGVVQKGVIPDLPNGQSIEPSSDPLISHKCT